LSHMIQAYVDSGVCKDKKILATLEDTLSKTKKYF